MASQTWLLTRIFQLLILGKGAVFVSDNPHYKHSDLCFVEKQFACVVAASAALGLSVFIPGCFLIPTVGGARFKIVPKVRNPICSLVQQ